MTPYCPTPQHLLHMQEGVNLLSVKTFGESNLSWIPKIFFEITLIRITLMLNDAQVS